MCHLWRPQSNAWDSETGLGSQSLEAIGRALHPLASTSPAQHRSAQPSSAQPPPPCGLPAPQPAALFWLQLLGVYVSITPTPSMHPLSPSSPAFSSSGFPSLSYFLTPDLSSHYMSAAYSFSLSFFHPLCLSSFLRLPDTGVVIVPSNY